MKEKILQFKALADELGVDSDSDFQSFALTFLIALESNRRTDQEWQQAIELLKQLSSE